MDCFIYMHKLQSCRCTFVIFAFLFTIDQKKSAKDWIIKDDRTHPLAMKIAISKIANLCYYFDINQYFVEVKAKNYVYLCYHTLDIWRKLYGFVIKNLIRHRWHISFTHTDYILSLFTIRFSSFVIDECDILFIWLYHIEMTNFHHR